VGFVFDPRMITMKNFLRKIPYWYLIAVPVLLIGLGAASNQAVLITNHGKFPVLINEAQAEKYCPRDPDITGAAYCGNGGEFIDGEHTVMNQHSRLKFLSDIFNMKHSIMSIGDFLLVLGEWIWDWSRLAWLVLVVRKLASLF